MKIRSFNYGSPIKGWNYVRVLSTNFPPLFLSFSYKDFVEEMMVLRSKSSLWPIHCSSPSHRRQYQRACAIRSFDIHSRREQKTQLRFHFQSWFCCFGYGGGFLWILYFLQVQKYLKIGETSYSLQEWHQISLCRFGMWPQKVPASKENSFLRAPLLY